MYLFSVYIYLQLMRIKDRRKLIQNHLEFFQVLVKGWVTIVSLAYLLDYSYIWSYPLLALRASCRYYNIFYLITSFTFCAILRALQCLYVLIRYLMSSRPDIHIQSSSLTLHCDIFHFDTISLLFLISHITTCDIHPLSFPLSLFILTFSSLHPKCWFSTHHYMEDDHIVPLVHLMDSGLEILV